MPKSDGSIARLRYCPSNWPSRAKKRRYFATAPRLICGLLVLPSSLKVVAAACAGVTCAGGGAYWMFAEEPKKKKISTSGSHLKNRIFPS